jgi:hypothetical protein
MSNKHIQANDPVSAIEQRLFNYQCSGQRKNRSKCTVPENSERLMCSEAYSVEVNTLRRISGIWKTGGIEHT